ncbi:MAG TPA: transcriptional regulator [Elusimicrobia bacterium]|nr:transcriptional regulator [Elusimicrobiota bacterium]
MRPETETLELKRSTSELKEGVISVASILNKHRNGELYFGVRNDGTVLGQAVSEQTLRDVSRAMSERIEPRIYPKVERVKLSGKDCVRVRFAGQDGPYFAFGRAYIRVGDEDRQISARELERMFRNRGGDHARWDSELSERKLSDVDATTVRRMVKQGRSVGRVEFEFKSVKVTLNKLKLLRNGRLLRAGEVLFCDENLLRVQAAVFAGTDKTTFIDIKTFEGPLFKVLENAETYVKEHIDWRVQFGKLEREEIPEIPMKALREALVNSLCHRDYQVMRNNEVAIFKDRVEIFNPGEFPEGYTPDDFIKGDERSMPRNPLVARVLFRTKDVEEWGSGLKRIAQECAANGVKVVFKALKSGFLVAFYRRPSGSDKSLGASGGKSGERLGEKLGERLGGTALRILALIHRDSRITISALSSRLRISTTAVEKNLAALKKRGLLRRIGPDKGGHWEVVGS